jgi:hypothetical protein
VGFKPHAWGGGYADDMMLLPPEARVGTCYCRSFAAARMCTTAEFHTELPLVQAGSSNYRYFAVNYRQFAVNCQ